MPDLASANAVAADGDVSAAEMLDGIGHLGAKSLLTTDTTGERALFHLLDTTRTYALEQLDACNESAKIRRRHAELCRAERDGAGIQAPEAQIEWQTAKSANGTVCWRRSMRGSSKASGPPIW